MSVLHDFVHTYKCKMLLLPGKIILEEWFVNVLTYLFFLQLVWHARKDTIVRKIYDNRKRAKEIGFMSTKCISVKIEQSLLIPFIILIILTNINLSYTHTYIECFKKVNVSMEVPLWYDFKVSTYSSSLLTHYWNL